jgi:RNA 2',3'-cyclic 3'-phosphodiesterase
MRQFLAIPLPDDIKKSIEGITGPFRGIPGVRPVRSENLHLTLLFIGDQGSEEKTQKIRQISFRPFELSTTSVELFPERKPRLIWIELETPGELSALHGKLAGIYKMEEEFRAHITIARIKWLSPENRKLLMELTGQLNPFKIGFRADHFNLYSSELKPDGPKYRVVESFKASPGGS